MIKKLLTFTLLLTLFAIDAKAADGETSVITWSYFYGSSSEWKKIGTGKGGTFSVAIRIPENSPLIGQSVKEIKVPSVDAAMRNLSGWIRTSLTSSNLVSKAITGTFRSGTFAEIELDEPFVIPEGGAYIGYTYSSTSPYSIATAGNDVSNGLFLGIDGSWSDYSHGGLGASPLQVVIEGVFPTNAAMVGPLGSHVLKVGETKTISVTLENDGTAGISNYDYVIANDGVAESEVHVDLATPLTGISQTTTLDLSIEAPEPGKCVTKTLTITKVNGVANEIEAVSTGKFTTVEAPLPRNVVVEEFTGTGCGWCPRGLVGMEELRKQYGDSFIGLALHQYNSTDAMFLASSNYASIDFPGAPSCTLFRNGEYIDPLYGGDDGTPMKTLIQKELDKYVTATVTVSGKWNEDKTAVEATAEVTSLLEDLSYNVEYVLVADDLSGSGTAWNQQNYYSQYGPQGDPLIDPYCAGGAYGTSILTGVHFNDVVCGSSYTNGVNTAEPLYIEKAGEPQTRQFTIEPKGKPALLNAIQKDKVFVVVLLIDEFGGIINGAKAHVEIVEDTAIKSMNSYAGEVARYTLDGQQINAPQKGVNIVKMSDGTTRKVIVK